jgi:hypothetical protein
MPGHCAAEPVSTCGLDGTCNGAGGCRKFAAGTVCVEESCSGSTYTPPRTCDSAGVCQTVTTSSCAPYQCGATACRNRCNNDSHCASGSTCQTNNRCTAPKKQNGDACGAGTECLTGFCAQGVCCNAPCAGTCEACNLTATLGTCTKVPDGQDPLNQCAADTGNACGADGMCNGAGACRMPANGTSCGAPSCTGGTAMSGRTCDGAGVCRSATSTSCGKFQCDGGAAVCRTSCSSDAECVGPSICSGGSCGGLKGEFFSGRNFETWRLTRVDPNINFDWGNTSGPDGAVGNDNFSIRWTGKLVPRFSETYTFETQTDDGVRLWVNNVLVIDKWTDHGLQTDTGTIALVAGTAYDLRLEFYENGGEAVVKLAWSSPSQAYEVVPTSQLTPAP